MVEQEGLAGIQLAGRPVLAEVFDTPSTLLSQFDSLIRAAALDAVGQEEIATPPRRARRFIERVGRVQRQAVQPAGLGTTLAGGDPYALIAQASRSRAASRPALG